MPQKMIFRDTLPKNGISPGNTCDLLLLVGVKPLSPFTKSHTTAPVTAPHTLSTQAAAVTLQFNESSLSELESKSAIIVVLVLAMCGAENTPQNKHLFLYNQGIMVDPVSYPTNYLTILQTILLFYRDYSRSLHRNWRCIAALPSCDILPL